MIQLLAILRKEMRITLRHRWFVTQLGLVMCGLAIPIYFVCTNAARELEAGALGGSGTVFFESRAYLARRLLTSIVAVELIGFGLMSALLMSLAVTQERENRTFELLLASGLGIRHILWGKWLAMLSSLALMAVCLLPMLALVFQMGGVGLGEYLTYGALLLQAIMAYGMIGLAVTTHARRSMPAMALTLGVVLTLLLAPGAADPVRFFSWVRFSATTGQALRSSGSAGAGLLLLAPLSPLSFVGAYGLNGVVGVGALLTHCVLQWGIFVTGLSISRAGLRRRETVRAQVATRLINNPVILAQRREQWPFYLIDPLRRPQSIGDRQNPFDVKERRAGAFSNIDSLIHISYVMMAASLVCIPIFAYFVRGSGYFYGFWLFEQEHAEFIRNLLLQLLIVGLALAPALAATTISREREEGTFHLLMGSPISEYKVVRGKFIASYRVVLALAGSYLVMPLFLYFVLQWRIPARASGRNFLDLLYWVSAGVVFGAALLAYFTALAVFCSSWCRNNAAALLVSYGLLMALLFAPSLAFSKPAPGPTAAQMLILMRTRPPAALYTAQGSLASWLTPAISPFGFLYNEQTGPPPHFDHLADPIVLAAFYFCWAALIVAATGWSLRFIRR